MSARELPPRYEPVEVERKWYAAWEDSGSFSAQPSDKEPFTIMIPPPNVTGMLHMGHVLNNTIQDILIRHKRMQQYEALWLPGMDHAGIATQNVVEKDIAKQGLTRYDLGRETFIERVWEWKEEFGGTIIRQLRKLGSSCDWTRERFTMDEGLSRAVAQVFVSLYKKDLVYRGKYIINWCPRCQTALSDEEVEYDEVDAHLYHLRYPIEDTEEFVHVATTRPETMLGDTAVAVHPGDERYSDLKDRTIILPIIGRRMKVIFDNFVDPEFGTGAVKVTPAHDPNDFLMGERHSLEKVDVMNDDGTMNDNAGAYRGMDRFECRETLLVDLKEGGFLVKVEPYHHSVGHCYRCHSVVEPRLSDQWFVRMKPLAEPAIDVVKNGRVTFYPERWTKVYLEWMENIRDWCISRQIWWGHRIPIYTCESCGEVMAAVDTPDRCEACGGAELRQDPDVLDTWFSSWLWPFSTLGWPDKTPDLDHFYSTQVLVTAPEIIFFWVARMIMAGLEFMGDIPFSRVYIHGIVRDGHGRKMSKSLGNSPDPLDIIATYGADALRMGMMLITPRGQDVLFSEKTIEIGRNFANKIWNMSRFVLMNLGDDDLPGSADIQKDDLAVEDRWILSRLDTVIEELNKAIEELELAQASQKIYQFIWSEVCDWYVEFKKADLYGDDEKRKTIARTVLKTVLEGILKLLHPFMPFLTEELYQALNGGESYIIKSPWPQTRGFKDEDAEYRSTLIRDVISAARTLRAENGVKPNEKRNLCFACRTDDARSILEDRLDLVQLLAQVSELRFSSEDALPTPSAKTVAGDTVVALPLSGEDLRREEDRTRRELARIAPELARASRKLGNKNFLTRAPQEVVEKVKAEEVELMERTEKLERHLKEITAYLRVSAADDQPHGQSSGREDRS